jgi:chromosome segregation ATPase
MSEGKGRQESRNERLDRIERALELILNDHVEFREEHKLLLSAQVLMQGGLEDLRKSTEDLRKGLDDLRHTVDKLAIKVDSLTSNVEAMRQNFDERLKRLESPRVQ